MSFIHYLYIGFFEHDGCMARFTSTATDPILRPVVSNPLDMDVIRRLLRECSDSPTIESLFPADWPVWLEDGYLACEQNRLTPEAVSFIVRLAQETGCDLVDFNARSMITPEDFSRLVSTTVQPAAVARD